MEPLVTVLLPVYNGEKYLRLAIDSVLSQTYANFEFLIVDDGSTDKSIEIVSSYVDPRIRLVKKEQNSGIVDTLNTGIREARGVFIARMDADDICRPERLERQVHYLADNPGVTMVDTIMEYIGGDGQPLNKFNNEIINEADIKKAMVKTNCMGHSSIMMRTQDYKVYLYRKIFYEDDDLWLRVLNDNKKIHKIPEPLLLYRIHEDSIIKKDKTNNLSLRKFIQTRRFYYRHLPASDKLKPFNLKILFWIMIYFGILQYKKIKAR